MAAIAQGIAKVPGVSMLQALVGSLAAALDKHTVPHWVDFLNDK